MVQENENLFCVERKEKQPTSDSLHATAHLQNL